MAKTLAEAYIDKLSEVIEIHRENLCSGSAQDYEEYRYVVGVLDGLGLAIIEFKDLVNRSVEFEDDDD